MEVEGEEEAEEAEDEQQEEEENDDDDDDEPPKTNLPLLKRIRNVSGMLTGCSFRAK